MARPKKDGVKVSLFLDRTMMEQLRAYADEKGQTMTTAIERIVTEKLNGENDKVLAGEGAEL